MKHENTVVNSIAITELIRSFGTYVSWIILSLYLYTVRDVSIINIGIIFLLLGILSAPFGMIGGNLIDRIGRRPFAIKLPLLSITVYTTMFLMIYFNMPIIYIIIPFIAYSPNTSLQYINDGAMVSDVTLEHERIDSFSKTRIYSNVGVALGLFTGGFISQFSYAYVFIIPVIGALLEEYIYITKIPETIPVHDDLTEDKINFREIRNAMKDRLFLIFAIVVALSSLASSQFESPMATIFFRTIDGFPIFFVTVLFVINAATVIFIQNPVNSLLNGVMDSKRLAMGLVVFATAFVIFGIFHNFIITCADVVILTIGENILVPAISTTLSKIAPVSLRGTYYGFFNATASLINPFSPLIGALLYAVYSEEPFILWSIISLIALVFALFFLGLNKQIEKREKELSACTIKF